MSFSKSLIRNSVIYTGSNIINASIPFLLLPILTRVLTPSDYGIVSMFGIVLSIASAFTGLSVHGAVSVEYFKKEKEDHANYVGACFSILLASTTALLLLSLPFHSSIVEYTKLPFYWVLITIFCSGAMFVINIKMTLWQVKQKAFNYAGMQISQSLFNALFSLLFILVFNWGWNGRLIGNSFAILSAAVVAYFLIVKDKEISFKFDKKDIKHALSFGLPLIPHSLGALLMVATDRFMISNMLGMAVMGVFMVGFQISMVLSLLTESFNRAYAPWLMETLSKNDHEKNRQIVGFTYIYFILVTLIAITIGILFPYVSSIFVGGKFSEANDIVIFVLMGFAFGGMYYMVTNYLFYAEKTRYLAVMTLCSGIVNIVLNYFLIKSNGILGASMSFMISQFVSFAGTWFIASRVCPMPWRNPLFNLKFNFL